MKKPDILLFMSDQHSYQETEHAGSPARTPNLTAIGKEGVTFETAYTSCPLCVPARVSFMTMKVPSKTGVYDNDGCIREDDLTFLHSMQLAGYETVLCGRMHFMGTDQRHGFSKRIADDVTNIFWAQEGMNDDMKAYSRRFGETGALGLVGSGHSPIEEYDKYVADTAVKYLEEEHEKPQLIVVGTYAPHFPYVGDKEEYDYYMSLETEEKPTKAVPHPATDYKRQECSPELFRSVRASYRAMVETTDKRIGEVKKGWDEYLRRTGKEGIFIYTSDHGDNLGDKEMFAKKSFYDRSSRIPLIFQGTGIREGAVIKSPANIMDIGETLIDLVGAPELPGTDGISLRKEIEEGCDRPERSTVSELMYENEGETILGRMVRHGNWKNVAWHGTGPDQRFDMEKDPDEEDPESGIITDCGTKLSYTAEEAGRIKERFRNETEAHELLKELIRMKGETGPDERWHPSERSAGGSDLEVTDASFEWRKTNW